MTARLCRPARPRPGGKRTRHRVPVVQPQGSAAHGLWQSWRCTCRRCRTAQRR